MDDVVKTIELNGKVFLIIDEMVHNNSKYYYLVNEDGNEFHIVKEIKEELNVLVESVVDENELKMIFNLFTERIANEKD